MLRMILSALTLLSCLLLSACERDRPSEPEISKPVSTITLSTPGASLSRMISGAVQPANSAQLHFDVTGTVAEVYVKLGQQFTEGDKLAELEQRDFRLLVKEREGQLSQAKATLKEAELDFDRNRTLLDRNAISQARFDVAQAQFKTAKDRVDIAAARLAMAKENLNDTVLRAPYDGSIAARLIEPSQRVSPNQPAFNILGTEGLEVAILAPETLLSDIRIGQEAKVRIPALNDNFMAEIKEIGTAAQEASAFPVTLQLKDSSIDVVKVGMSAEVTLQLASRDIATNAGHFTLPVSAVLAVNDNRHVVFKLVPNKDEAAISSSPSSPSSAHEQVKMASHAQYTLNKTEVNIQRYFDQHVVISGGVHAGDILVDAGLAFLQDGMTVSPISQGIARYNP